MSKENNQPQEENTEPMSDMRDIVEQMMRGNNSLPTQVYKQVLVGKSLSNNIKSKLNCKEAIITDLKVAEEGETVDIEIKDENNQRRWLNAGLRIITSSIEEQENGQCESS